MSIAVDSSVVIRVTDPKHADHEYVKAWFGKLEADDVKPWVPTPVLIEAISGESDPERLYTWFHRHTRMLAFDARAASEAAKLIVKVDGRVRGAALLTKDATESMTKAKERVKLDFMILATAMSNGHVLYAIDRKLSDLAMACGAGDHIASPPRIAMQTTLPLS